MVLDKGFSGYPKGDRMKPTVRFALLVVLLLALFAATSGAAGGTCSVECTNGATNDWQSNSGSACFDQCLFACGLAGQGVYTCEYRSGDLE
jgi:hypothetical protein